jgi:hypothetical protein
MKNCRFLRHIPIAFNFAIIFSLVACKEKATVTEVTDSISYDSKPVILDDTTIITESMAEEIQLVLRRLSENQAAGFGKRYTLKLVSVGFQYETNATWSFDSVFNLSYCKEFWTSDSAQGVSEYFFRKERIYAASEESVYDSATAIDLYHTDFGGITFTRDASGIIDSTRKPLEQDYVSHTEKDLKIQLREIQTLLKTHKKELKGKEQVILTVEDKAKDAKAREKTTLTLDHELLRRLVKD